MYILHISIARSKYNLSNPTETYLYKKDQRHCQSIRSMLHTLQDSYTQQNVREAKPKLPRYFL